MVIQYYKFLRFIKYLMVFFTTPDFFIIPNFKYQIPKNKNWIIDFWNLELGILEDIMGNRKTDQETFKQYSYISR